MSTSTPPEPMDFQAYSGAYYHDKSQGAAQWVDGRTPIPFLEVLALRMTWALEFQMVPFESSHMHDFASELIVKLIHEIRCLVACARAGSSFGTFIHARGALECAAMGQYVFGSGEKLAQERALRWATYREAVRYLHGGTSRCNVNKGKFLTPSSRSDASPVPMRLMLRVKS